MHARLLAQLEPVLKQEFASAKGAMHAVTLTMVVQPGGVQGECRLDGQVFPKILERAAQFDWPRTQAGYMFKQYYVLVPKLYAASGVESEERRVPLRAIEARRNARRR
jgi:hypothetical protein